MTRPQAATLPLSFAAHGLALGAVVVFAVGPGELPAARAASTPRLEAPVLRVAQPRPSAAASAAPRRSAPASTTRMPRVSKNLPAGPPEPLPGPVTDVLGEEPDTTEPGRGADCLGCDSGRFVGGTGEPPTPEHGGPAGAPIRVGGNIREPRKMRHVAPSYPEMARIARVQGTVVVECTLTPEGRVADMRVVRGHTLLNEAALRAVEQWLFTPTLLNGVPVPVILTVTVNFQLG
jgi:protein TonB